MVGTYHKQNVKILCHIIFPVFCGIIIYGLFRGLHFIDPNEEFFSVYSIRLPELLKYNLPDGLWFYSLISAITIIWKGSYSAYFSWWLLLAIVLAYLTEIFQALYFIPRTFDWNDLLAYSVAIMVYILNFRIPRKQFQITNN